MRSGEGTAIVDDADQEYLSADTRSASGRAEQLS